MTIALALAVASGPATAETENGLIYFLRGNGIAFVDPQSTNPQPTVISEGNTFDISHDRTTLVYSKGYFGSGRTGPLYTLPLPDKPYSGGQGTEVNITNLWKCVDCESQKIEQPRFSPDGKTIYFRGVDVLDPSEDTAAIYSVPTEGGQATKISIDWFDSDGTRVPVASFGLSHDGSKFALGGGSRGLFTVPVRGGIPTRVTTELCGGAADPSFSPDDQMVVYSSFIRGGDNCTGTGHWTIYTTPTNNDGTSPGTPLFPEDATDSSQSLSKYYPTYSPDGKNIAFANWRDGTYKLATAPAMGGPITNIADCAFCHPLWIEKGTVDTTAPVISNVSPADQSQNVPLATNVEATFSENMDASDTDGDPSTLTPSTFTLTKQGSSTPVGARVSYDSASKKATLDPSSDLEANTTYTATIKGGSTGAEDLAGNALAQDYTWTFTTAAPPAPDNCTKIGTDNAETISGTSGADVICAGGGNDTVKGLGGNDILKGEAGNDKLLGGVGDDTLDGGFGTDTASYSASLTGVSASLATNRSTGEGTDTFLGVENLLGSSKADTLTGSGANNTLTGGGGDDTERGGAGNDKVVGSGGADFLYGEEGADTVNSKDGVNGNDSLEGGAGTDTKVSDTTEKSIVGFP